jgi:hypothetical protein
MEFEKELPVFYREALARLLRLEHFRNLIETQALDAGTTVYTDHAPSTYVGSLSNKGRLSTWRITRLPTLQGSYRPSIRLDSTWVLARTEDWLALSLACLEVSSSIV